jgi:hypothetical protein
MLLGQVSGNLSVMVVKLRMMLTILVVYILVAVLTVSVRVVVLIIRILSVLCQSGAAGKRQPPTSYK